MKIAQDMTRYDDFKYVLQDVGSLYLGAGFSYEELLAQELVPFKLKAILSQYVLKEASPETTLESQFYYLEEDTFLYGVFSQLKIQIRVQEQTPKKQSRRIFGNKSGQALGTVSREKFVYQEKVYSLKELAGINIARKKTKGMLVREIIVSKLGMMTFSL